MTQSAKAARIDIGAGFAVPFAQAEHPDPAALNEALRDLFLAREGEGSRFRNSDPTMNATPARTQCSSKIRTAAATFSTRPVIGHRPASRSGRRR